MNVSLPSFPYAIIRLNNLSANDVDVFIVAFLAVTPSLWHRVWRELYRSFEPITILRPSSSIKLGSII